MYYMQSVLNKGRRKMGKRILTVFLLIMLIAGFSGCAKRIETDVCTIEGEPIANIHIVIEESSVSSEGLTFVITNNTDKELKLTGSCYLEHKAVKWEEVADSNGDPAALEIKEITVSPASKETVRIRWAEIYGEIQPGEYRLVLTCIIDGQECKPVKPFTVK